MAEKELILRVKAEGQESVTDMKTRLDALNDSMKYLSASKLKIDDSSVKSMKLETQALRVEIKNATDQQKQLNLAAKDLKFSGQTSDLRSLDAISGKLLTLQSQLAKVAIGSEAFDVLSAKVKLAGDEFKRAQAVFNKSTGSLGQMSIVGRNFNFVMQDSVFFFKNFQLGVLAIGNNLDPLVQSIIRANEEAKAMGRTFGQQVIQLFKGPGGLIIILGTVVAAFQAVVFAMQNSKSEADKHKDAIQELIDKYITLEEKLQSDIHKIETKSVGDLVILYRGLNEELKEYDENIIRLKTINTQGFSKEAIDFINALRGGTVNSGGKNELRSSIDEIGNSIKNIIALTDKKQLKLFFAFDPTKSQTDLDAAKRALEEFGKSQSKFVIGTLKIGAEQFKLTGQQALNYAKAVDEAFKENKKKAKDSINDGMDIKESWDILDEGVKKAEEDIAEYFKEAIIQTNYYNDSIEEAKKATESFVDSAGKLILRGQTSEENKDESLLIARYRLREKIELGHLEKLRQEALSQERITNAQKLEIDKAYQQAKAYNASYYADLTMEAQLKEYKVISDAMASTLTSAFSQAWADIFGEANSLFEQFMQTVFAALAELAAQSLARDILGGILGLIGIGSLFATGGASAAVAVPFHHKGGIVKAHEGMLASDEVPIIARKGEMIFNDRQQGNLFNLINNPPTNRGGSDGGTINITMPIILDGKIIAREQYKYLPSQLGRIARERIPLN